MLPIPVLLTVGLVGLLAGFNRTARLSDRELAMAAAIVDTYPRCPPALADEIVLTARHIGADAADLANLVRFETANTFSGRVQHPNSRATGVLQFMPSTARRLGTTVDAIAALPAARQLRTWGRKYFDTVRRGRPLDTRQRLYMAVFYPAAMDWPPGRTFPPEVTEANPGITTPADYIRLAERGARL